VLLRDNPTESRLFGALMCEPAALEWSPFVEIYDFSDLHLQFAFMALRNVQARGDTVNVTAVADELEHLGYLQVDITRVAATALEEPYNHEILVRHDARWLRRLANRRRNV
jgi:hypothetical protein